jgi:hypothetical protein
MATARTASTTAGTGSSIKSPVSFVMMPPAAASANATQARGERSREARRSRMKSGIVNSAAT